MLPPSSPPGRAAELLRGASLPFQALGLVVGTPRLLLLSLLCAAVTAGTLLALLLGLWPLAGHLAHGWVGTGGWRSVAGAGLEVLLYLVMLVVGALTVPNLVLAPLLDPLSEATEVKLGGFVAPAFSVARLIRGTLLSLRHTLARLVLLALGFLLLLPLNAVPVAGSVAYAVLSALWAMGWLAAEYLSGPMARHLLPFRAVLHAIKERPFLAMGMGATLYGVLWLPVVNCFLVPLAVVAGTLLFRLVHPVDGNAGAPRGVLASDEARD